MVDESFDDMRFYEAQALDMCLYININSQIKIIFTFLWLTSEHEFGRTKMVIYIGNVEIYFLAPACGHVLIFPSDFDRLLASGRSVGLVLIYCVVFNLLRVLLFNRQVITFDQLLLFYIDFGIRSELKYHVRKVEDECNIV